MSKFHAVAKRAAHKLFTKKIRGKAYFQHALEKTCVKWIPSSALRWLKSSRNKTKRVADVKWR